jgi:hypothetical protein
MAGTAGQLQSKHLRNETRPYGYAIVAAGYIRPEEAEVWARDLKRLVAEGGASSSNSWWTRASSPCSRPAPTPSSMT